jgi:hypothetical protein
MFNNFSFELGVSSYLLKTIPRPIVLFLTALIVAALILPTVISASMQRDTIQPINHLVPEQTSLTHHEDLAKDLYEKVSLEVSKIALVGKVSVSNAPKLNPEIEFKKWLGMAESGDSHAQRIIGYFFEEGEGVTANAELALFWYRKSAENGNGEAQWLLGNILKDQVVGKVAEVEAKYWLTKAQESGYGVKRWINVNCPKALMRIAKLKKKNSGQIGT